MGSHQTSRPPRSFRSTALALLSASNLIGVPTVAAQDNNSTSPPSSKRGLSIHGKTNTADFNIFLQRESPVAWYYTWSPWPNDYIEKASATNGKKIEFLPLVHGIDNIDQDLERVAKLDPAKSGDRLLTFNEPDGDKDSGGSDLDPKDAARAYIDKIMPLRKEDGGKWKISHPVVTGSPRGLDWLKEFCEACEVLNGDTGCPTDFVAAHWYGEFLGLEGWLGQLKDFYEDPKHSFRPDLNDSSSSSSSRSGGGGRADDEAGDQQLQIIVTELGLPQKDLDTTETMLNETIPYLDGASWVSGYSWFGLFREGSDDAGGWAGEAVAMLDGNGGLTELGAMFLAPPTNSSSTGGGGGGGGQESGGGQQGPKPGDSVPGDQSGDGSGNSGSGASQGVRVPGWTLVWGLGVSFVGFSFGLM